MPDQPGQQPLSPLESAREHLRGSADPGRSLAMARELRQRAADGATSQRAASDAGDAAFLLLEDAASKGNAPAMFLLGNYYDPGIVAPKGTIQPDPQQAYQWYLKAQQAGEPQAGQALEGLRAWARKAAASGNRSAQELLNMWK